MKILLDGKKITVIRSHVKVSNIEDIKILYAKYEHCSEINDQMERIGQYFLDNRDNILRTKDIKIKANLDSKTAANHLKILVSIGVIYKINRGYYQITDNPLK